jgi:SAM-dependent methyltransferase
VACFSIVDDGTGRGQLDGVNRPTWAEVAEEYAIEGWSDPGELGALTFVADRVRGLPILDLGVGGGRTVALLRLLSADYLGIDYTPELVELCRARHPDVEVEVGDARDLSGLAEGSRGLVVFSNNGIDAVDHGDRQRVLAGVHRVLEPGGTFVFSTLNKDNPLFGAHPGTALDIGWVPGSLLPAPVGVPPVGAPAADDDSWVRAVRNWRRLRGQTRDEGEWGLAPFAAHEFGLVTHFVTLGGAVEELDRHGFDVAAVFPCDSVRPRADSEPVESMYMHLVAHRRVTSV